MKPEFWAAAIVSSVLAFAGLYCYGLVRKEHACRERGGVYVQAVFGYACVKGVE